VQRRISSSLESLEGKRKSDDAFPAVVGAQSSDHLEQLLAAVPVIFAMVRRGTQNSDSKNGGTRLTCVSAMSTSLNCLQVAMWNFHDAAHQQFAAAFGTEDLGGDPRRS